MAKKNEAPCLMLSDETLSKFKNRLTLQEKGILLDIAVQYFHGQLTDEQALQKARESDDKGFLQLAVEDTCRTIGYGMKKYADKIATGARNGIKGKLTQLGWKEEDFKKKVGQLKSSGMSESEITQHLRQLYQLESQRLKRPTAQYPAQAQSPTFTMQGYVPGEAMRNMKVRQ